MSIRLVTDATGEPVSLAEQKLFLRVSTATTTEDSMISGMITAARKIGENITKRSWMPQTFEEVMDSFPSGGIRVLMPPISTSSTNVSITYVDSSGVQNTLDSTAYSIDSDSEPAFITPSYDNDWPDTRDQINAVRVRFVSGYPLSDALAITTPEPLKMWIKMRVAQMYECREPVQPGSMSELPRNYVDGLLDAYCIIDLKP